MTLIVMSGLPGSGKSNVAEELAVDLDCAVISVDTIERGPHEAGVEASQPIGLAAYAVECPDETLHRERLATREHVTTITA